MTDTEHPLLTEAVELFETRLLPDWKKLGPDVRLVHTSDMSRLALEMLVEAKLVKQDGSNILLTRKGNDVVSGRTSTREVLLVAANPPTPQSPISITATNIGAIATGPHGQAHGSVNVGLETDRALHRLIESQDELGALSDELWKVLRRVRDLEIKGTDLKEAVDDLEIERFKEAMKASPDLGKVLKTLFEASPTLLKLGSFLLEASQ